MAQGFTELIYDSTQAPIGVSETGAVDRLLGIGTDGTAKVVGITGNYKVLVGGDIVNDHTTGSALTNKMYSCKATADLVKSKIQDSESSDATSTDKTYSCRAIKALVAASGGSGVGVVAYDSGAHAAATDVAYHCKGTHDAISAVIETGTSASTMLNDAKAYSCKATAILIGGKIVADADKDDQSVVDEDTKTYSCKAIRSLVSGAGGGGYWTLSNSYIKPEYNLSMGRKVIWFGGEQQGAPSFRLTTGNPSSGSSAGISLSCGADIYSASCIEAASSLIAKTLKLHDSNDNVTGTISCVYQPAGIGDHLSSDLKIQAPSFYESSDASLKEDVAPLSESALSAAASVPLVEFDWKSDGTHSYGTIAQECEKYMPEVVGMGADGKKSVNYIALLCAKVAALEKEVAELKSKVQ